MLCCAESLSQTLYGSLDCSPPGSSVLGILQARILEWVAMPSSRESSQPRDRTHHTADGFFTIWGTWEACEYWKKPIPSLGDLPDPGVKHRSPVLLVDSLSSLLTGLLTYLFFSLKWNFFKIVSALCSPIQILKSACYVSWKTFWQFWLKFY